MFGTMETRKLRAVFTFNHSMDCIYEDKNMVGDDLLVVLWDKSGSMEGKQMECKMVASALKCLTGTQGAFNIPDAGGGTALVDAVDSTIAMQIPGVKDFLIVTDGDDTSSKVEKLVAGFYTFEGGGEPIMVDLPPRGKTKGTVRVRSEAVAEHLSNIGVRTFIVGIGEVKDFISTLAKKGDGRIITAHIPVPVRDDQEPLTIAQVGAVIATTLHRQPLGTVNAANATPLDAAEVRAIARETVVAANATPLAPDQVQEITVQVALTSTRAERARNPALLKDGPAFDAARQEAYVAFILSSEAARIGCEPALLRSALGWFRDLVRNLGVPVAGDLIGGRMWLTAGEPSKGAVFSPPTLTKPGKGHAWAATLGRCIELLSRNPEAINAHRARVPGLNAEFAAEIRAGSVGPLFREVGKLASFLALTAEHLPEQLAHQVLFYKFKADTYLHYALHHRANAYELVPRPDPCLADLSVAGKGNSGMRSYGGPPVEATPLPGAELTAACEEASEDASDASDAEGDEGDDTASATGSSSADPEEVALVNRLKRKVEVLEEANKELKTVAAENALLKRKLAAILTGCDR